MTTHHLLILLILACSPLAGCKDPVVGTYVLDKEAMKAEPQKKSLEGDQNDTPDETATILLALVEAMDMTLTLNADGTAVMVYHESETTRKASGTYKVVDNIISLDMKEAGRERELATGELKEGALILYAPPDAGIELDLVFKKSK